VRSVRSGSIVGLAGLQLQPLCEVIQQHRGVLEIGGIESFVEPLADWSQHRERFVASALPVLQTSEADCGAQFPRQCALLARPSNRLGRSSAHTAAPNATSIGDELWASALNRLPRDAFSSVGQFGSERESRPKTGRSSS
jgi:hypothetical protein